MAVHSQIGTFPIYKLKTTVTYTSLNTSLTERTLFSFFELQQP